MQTEGPSNQSAERCSQIANLIRNSYTDLRKFLRSPYADGEEVHRALVALGYDLSNDGSEIVAEALGWKCMRLPVANVDGKPRHYLPSAVSSKSEGASTLSERVDAFVREL